MSSAAARAGAGAGRTVNALQYGAEVIGNQVEQPCVEPPLEISGTLLCTVI